MIDAACVRDLPLAAVREALRGLLLRLGWPRPFPLLVSVWESPVCTTPSVQLWVPHAGAGTPIVEGIFEQQVCGPTGVFTGAVPADLPEHIGVRIVREAVLNEYKQIAAVLDPVFASLSLETLQKLNARIAVNGEDAAAVARDYLKSRGFLP